MDYIDSDSSSIRIEDSEKCICTLIGIESNHFVFNQHAVVIEIDQLQRISIG